MALSETEKTQTEVAMAIGRTARQVYNLTEQGVFVRIPSKFSPKKLAYPWPDTLNRWVEYQVKQKAEHSAGSGKSDAASRALLADAETKEFKLAQLRAEYVPRESYREELKRVLSRIAAAIDTFPGKHGPRLPGDAPIAEKVSALRAIARELRAEMKRAGYLDDEDAGAPESAA